MGKGKGKGRRPVVDGDDVQEDGNDSDVGMAVDDVSPGKDFSVEEARAIRAMEVAWLHTRAQKVLEPIA